VPPDLARKRPLGALLGADAAGDPCPSILRRGRRSGVAGKLLAMVPEAIGRGMGADGDGYEVYGFGLR
jgi:hypothetical protein